MMMLRPPKKESLFGSIAAAVAVMDSQPPPALRTNGTPTIQQATIRNALTSSVHATEKRPPVTERIIMIIVAITVEVFGSIPVVIFKTYPNPLYCEAMIPAIPKRLMAEPRIRVSAPYFCWRICGTVKQLLFRICLYTHI